ncbi:hypothetical protein B0J13DRAFT_513064 [Dactylonectria estremocensis]|uniref:BZIP domain-containing protein n=1 Tax=Dactylonectria estremocensis TaxID=1079267 RepID=A0A9P9DJL9_9HYPO|nr:hypothetical protein B0J13DRAFT_513064 [Dactylonectria estremocensis]
MKSLSNVREPGDDWTGVTNQARRKKLQNRLNQRAYRLRKRHTVSPSACINIHHPSSNTSSLDSGTSNDVAHQEELEMLPRTAGCGKDVTAVASFEGCVLLTCPRRIHQITCLARQAYEDYALRAPRPAHLQVLIRLNVLTALARNAVCMGFLPEGLCRDDFISPYSTYDPRFSQNSKQVMDSPPALQPTSLQRTAVHHPWIDLLPFPQLRDNVLLSMESGFVIDDDLCQDLLLVDDARDLNSKPSLMVWGMPWDSRAWEVNPAFLRKWGFLLLGCKEIMEGTNYWREKRGEKPLVFEV